MGKFQTLRWYTSFRNAILASHVSWTRTVSSDPPKEASFMREFVYTCHTSTRVKLVMFSSITHGAVLQHPDITGRNSCGVLSHALLLLLGRGTDTLIYPVFRDWRNRLGSYYMHVILAHFQSSSPSDNLETLKPVSYERNISRSLTSVIQVDCLPSQGHKVLLLA
jgi:hypothetical protein